LEEGFVSSSFSDDVRGSSGSLFFACASGAAAQRKPNLETRIPSLAGSGQRHKIHMADTEDCRVLPHAFGYMQLT
jgi:hypothetical protein